MGTAEAAAIVQVLLTIGLTGRPAQTPSVAAELDGLSLELHVLTYRTLDDAGVRLARETAEALLGSAGIRVSWCDCSGGDGRCAATPGGVSPFVRVQLVPIAKAADPTISGDAMRAADGARVALLYMPRIEHMAQALRNSRAGRANPVLASVQTGHLVGLTIAHEVGHTLGLAHASAGLMKPQFGPDDVLASRRSALAFTVEESTRMRQAIDGR